MSHYYQNDFYLELRPDEQKFVGKYDKIFFKPNQCLNTIMRGTKSERTLDAFIFGKMFIKNKQMKIIYNEDTNNHMFIDI